MLGSFSAQPFVVTLSLVESSNRERLLSLDKRYRGQHVAREKRSVSREMLLPIRGSPEYACASSGLRILTKRVAREERSVSRDRLLPIGGFPESACASSGLRILTKSMESQGERPLYRLLFEN